MAKSRKHQSKSQQIQCLRLILCQELVIQHQLHKIQLIYLIWELNQLLQRVRLILLNQLSLQLFGELNPQMLQNHLLTRQLQVYLVLVYFLECQ